MQFRFLVIILYNLNAYVTLPWLSFFLRFLILYEQFLGLVIHVRLWIFLKSSLGLLYFLWPRYKQRWHHVEVSICSQQSRIWRCPGGDVAGSSSFCYQPYKLRRTAFNRYSNFASPLLSFCLTFFPFFEQASFRILPRVYMEHLVLTVSF